MKKLLTLCLVFLFGCIAEESLNPAELEYPEEPYGVHINDVVPPSFKWIGYDSDSESLGIIHTLNLFDPYGDEGINAIFFDISSWNCKPCQRLAVSLKEREDGWRSMGIKSISMLYRSQTGIPTTYDALLWKKEWGFDYTAVVTDEKAKMIRGEPEDDTQVFVPWIIIVNPRNMRIIYSKPGLMKNFAKVENLAIINGKI